VPHPGAYRGRQASKRLKRLEKQEAKRQKRLEKPDLPNEAGGAPALWKPGTPSLPGEFAEEAGRDGRYRHSQRLSGAKNPGKSSTPAGTAMSAAPGNPSPALVLLP